MAVDLGARRERLASWVGRRYLDRSPVVAAVATSVAAYLGLFVVLLLVGLALTEPAGFRDAVRTFDREVTAWFVDLRTDLLDPVFRVFSTLVDTWTVVGALVAGLAVLLVERRWWQVAVLALAPLIELATFLTVTFLVARPRPDVALGMVPVTGSYPSGHAAMVIALYGGLAVVVRSRATKPGVRRAAAGIAVLLAAGVGISRLYLGLHYFTDVVMGWLLGIASLGAAVVAADAVSFHVLRNDADPVPRSRPSTGRRVRTAAGLVLAALIAWGAIVEPRLILTVQERDAALPQLPAGWEDATVAVFGDLQIGMWLDNPGMARKAVDAVLEERPAAAVILGDFVYSSSDVDQHVQTAARIVRPLGEAGIPTFAVLGNHDYAAGAVPELEAQLAAVGVTVLQNDAVAVRRDGDPLYVVGIGPALPGRARPEEALAAVPDEAARVVAMHNPATFDRLPAGSAPLGIAGHTHGGQVRVPFKPSWSFLRLVEDHAVHADGWIDGYGAPGNRLFVNRGIGMSLVPLRLNCTPAVTLFRLHRPR